MDAFYASIEQRDNPSLRGQPVAVGGSSRRGVVAAASYEARTFGIHSAMPSAEAARRCPHLIFCRPRFDVYRAVSRQVRTIFHAYTDLVEPLSLDEAYLDVTAPKQGPPSGTLLAQAIKQEIREATGLTASAGVAASKFLAKVASGWEKPDGLTVITPDEAPAFIAQLAVEDFHGIGPVTARKMKGLDLHTGADLRAWSEEALVQRFGKRGRYFHRLAHNRDTRPVRPHRERKSVGAERTFGEDLRTRDEMTYALHAIAAKVSERMENAGVWGRTVTLKLRTDQFETTTRQSTRPRPLRSAEALHAIAVRLLDTPAPPERPLRLLGLTAGSLLHTEHPARQLVLPFDGTVPEEVNASSEQGDERALR